MTIAEVLNWPMTYWNVRLRTVRSAAVRERLDHYVSVQTYVWWQFVEGHSELKMRFEFRTVGPSSFFFWKALLLIRITQNGRRPAPGGAHRNWTYRD